jgi:hypothetical protein
MSALLVCLLALTAPSDALPTYQEGKATFYRSGLLERVAARRGIALDGATGYSTFPDCSRLGWRIRVSVLDPRTGRWSGWEWKRVVDCSQPADYARHVRTGLVELSYKDAQRYGYAGEGRTRVRFYAPVR